MLKISALLVVFLAVAVPSAAQLIYDAVPAAAWVNGSTCSAPWAALSPSQTRPAQPDTYHVARPDGGPRMVWSLAAVQSAWTVNGILRQADLDAALVSGVAVSLRPGRGAQVQCTWRPLGGSP